MIFSSSHFQLLPRTDKNETPIDIARANGHQELANLLDNWVIEPPISDRHSWLHSDATGRSEAIVLLSKWAISATTKMSRSKHLFWLHSGHLYCIDISIVAWDISLLNFFLSLVFII